MQRYAALVQELPASESHHHAYLGGMLDHGIEIVAYAVKLRHTHLLPIGANTRESNIAVRSLDCRGRVRRAAPRFGEDCRGRACRVRGWNSVASLERPPLTRPYRFRYKRDRLYRLHSAATGLMFTAVLSDRILDWLSEFTEAWTSLLFLLAGQYEHAGVLGELVRQADQASVAAALGGDPTKAIEAPTHSLQRKLIDGLRYLVREKLRLNQPEASDGWLTDGALWFVSKTVCDKLRAHLLAQGADGIPSANTILFDVLQEHGIVQPTTQGKAIWSATVVSANGWTNTFTFLKISPHLIWSDDARPDPFLGDVRATSEVQAAPVDRAKADGSAIASETKVATTEFPAGEDDSPSLCSSVEIAAHECMDTAAIPTGVQGALGPSSLSPIAGANELEVIQAKARPELIGELFMEWLRDGIRSRSLIVNDAMALVHTVDGTAYLVTPGIFRRYADEHPSGADVGRSQEQTGWEIVQKAFERLRIHRKQANGLNIWTCQVAGPRRTRRLHGYLLVDGRAAFMSMPSDNPYLTLDRAQQAG
jgi:Putative helicase/Putative conjugal transfer nickase/helicase TraI C-term